MIYKLLFSKFTFNLSFGHKTKSLQSLNPHLLDLRSLHNVIWPVHFCDNRGEFPKHANIPISQPVYYIQEDQLIYQCATLATCHHLMAGCHQLATSWSKVKQCCPQRQTFTAIHVILSIRKCRPVPIKLSL